MVVISTLEVSKNSTCVQIKSVYSLSSSSSHLSVQMFNVTDKIPSQVRVVLLMTGPYAL